MENLAIEKLRSPRSPRRYSGSFYYPESGNNSGASTPFMSAPASPRGGGYYYSLPPSPPRMRSAEEDQSRAAVPFSWEESPGTPKRAGMKNSVDHLSAMGFHFSSAPVSPKREEFDFMDGFKMTNNHSSSIMEEEFEFSSARMSDAESVASVSMSHADELFFQGQILPLKLPPRLQQQKSSVSLNLQVQEIVGSDNFSFTPRVRAGASFVHQVHSPRSPKLPGYGFSSPKASRPRSPRAKSPSKLARAGKSQDENKHEFSSHSNLPQQRSLVSSSTSSVRRSLKELLHLNALNNGASGTSSTSTSRSNSSGTEDSHKSSRSGSQRFSNSRSSSVSSNRSVGSARSSKQVTPVPHELLQSYNNNRRFKAEELRRRTFLPYKQGLLGFLGCISFESFREVHDPRH